MKVELEVRNQILEVEKKLPDLLIACIGGGSNALGLFHEFLEWIQYGSKPLIWIMDPTFALTKVL